MGGANLITALAVGGMMSAGAVSSLGGDWPQFLGPQRDGSTTNSVTVPWPSDGPVRRWKLSVGSGFSGPVVRDGKVILFDRRDDQERVQALDLRNGKVLWEHRAPTAYVDSFGFDNGPRGTPATTPERVVTFGAEGRLTCLRLADGAREWVVETGRELGGDKGFFGPACSPLIVSNRIFLNLGNRDGGGIAAFSLDTGRLLWKRTDHEAGYASPVVGICTLASGLSSPLALFFTREGFVGATYDGDVRFKHPWRSRQHASVNAASPLVVSNEVFLTASYDTGATLLRLGDRGVKVIWSSDEALSAHYATPVVRQGFLYGFHGRQEQGPEFRCVEWATGKVRWKQENLGAGTVALAGDRLVLLLESGELQIAEANPQAFRPLGRAQVLGRDTRAPFALAEGALVARDPRQLICVEVGKPTL
ncbi:MAG TPA: PQQ-binding-like beta-propeller repeat protein [Verrucomicrobiota bacterium]|nr:PQQ-binding-like beta-propeller repeat protein [Verrucomicrobiota bacterium]